MSGTPLISLTPSAAKRVGALLAKEDSADLMFRVAVSGGGCSGFQYGFSFDDTTTGDDEVFEQDGIRIVVDNMSMLYVAGSQIDFVEDMIGSAFSLKNPNATASCSCGTSFAVG